MSAYLCFSTQHSVGTDMSSRADFRVAFDDDMGIQSYTLAKDDACADHAPRTDLHALFKESAFFNDCCGVNCHRRSSDRHPGSWR